MLTPADTETLPPVAMKVGEVAGAVMVNGPLAGTDVDGKVAVTALLEVVAPTGPTVVEKDEVRVGVGAIELRIVVTLAGTVSTYWRFEMVNEVPAAIPCGTVPRMVSGKAVGPKPEPEQVNENGGVSAPAGPAAGSTGSTSRTPESSAVAAATASARCARPARVM